MDRLTSETFPDGTSRIYAWDKLDLVAVTDRQGRTTRYVYDAVRNLVAIIDPLGNSTQLGYFENQKLKSLTDPKGNTTTWDIDIESRFTAKHYPDNSVVSNTFEATTSRLKAITDAVGQIKQLAYAPDNRLSGVRYLNALNPTPSLRFGYDPSFPRISSMTDGSGTTGYQYWPVGATGALKLSQESSPFRDTILYQYDALGRVVARLVANDNETFAYDPLGRLISHASGLGTFSLSYLGQTNQIVSLLGPSGGTRWGYDSNVNDRRLMGIISSELAVYKYPGELDYAYYRTVRAGDPRLAVRIRRCRPPGVHSVE